MTVRLRTVLLIAFSAMFLGATVFRAPIAEAAKNAMEVIVTNDATQPVPVHEQQRTTPVQAADFATFPTGDRFSSTVTLYTIPAGKMLIIESVSTSSHLNPNDRVLDVRFEVNIAGFASSYTIYLQPADEGIFTGTNVRTFRGTSVTRAYAGPGTTVTATGVRDGTSLSGTALYLAIAGQLVDAP